ncbi:SRPBCC domain-containing protein, partial [Serratia ureilytica]|nr:SRPBCC domain-containing protein [Serratia ureilytica]
MNKQAEPPPHERLVLEYSLDAPPEKVWRALSEPELREQWLPTG